MRVATTAVLGLAATAAAHKSLKIFVSDPLTTDLDALKLTTTIVNTGNETLKLVNDPRTPLSSMETNTFAVANEVGAIPEFTGLKVIPVPFEELKNNQRGFTVLEPGHSVNVTHEVGHYYDFSRSGAGTYRFEPVNIFTELTHLGEFSPIIADTVAAAVEVTKKLVADAPLFARRDSAHHISKRATFQSCSSTQQTTLNQVIPVALQLAKNAVTHLTNNPSGSTLQTTWYGTFSSSHWTKTKAAFTTLQTDPSSWTYDCSCTNEAVYATIGGYPRVVLCTPYWGLPLRGSRSLSTTVIHEGFHWRNIFGAVDNGYTEDVCKAMAINTPDKAKNNADSHAIFSGYA